MRTGTLFLIVGLAACSPSRPAQPERSTTPSTGASRLLIPEATPEPAAADGESRALVSPATGDLDVMLLRGIIRVLVAPNRTDFFTDAAQSRGAVVDAGKAFEGFVNRTATTVGGPTVRVVFIPQPPEQLLPALIAGRGDVIAGRFAKTFEREEVVLFGEPIATGVREVLVTGPAVPPIVSLEDVAGRSIHVRKGSDHFASLMRLNGQLAKIGKPVCTIVAMDASLTDEDLLQMVNGGRVPVTLVDQYLAAAWRPLLDKIAINPDVSVSQDGVYAWAVRKDSPRLLALINDFMRTHDLRGLDARSVARWRRAQ